MPSDNDVTYFARTNFRNAGVPFGIRRADRRSHLYAIGQTGVGKSTLLKTFMREDMEHGEGFALLDPHGDLAKEVAALVPLSRRSDLIYLDVPDESLAWHFNPFEGVPKKGNNILDSASGMCENSLNSGSSHAALPPPWVREPYRLWSLLDIMEIIDKDSLIRLLQVYGLGNLMTGLRQAVDRVAPPGTAGAINLISGDGVILSTPEKLEVADSFAKMGLPHSADLMRQWATRSSSLPRTEILMPELQRRIQHEIQSILWLYIPRERAKYYNASDDFGEDVLRAFHSARYDITEAGKCYALARYTACVFHLMRVMEVALRALARTLNDPRLDPKRNPSWDSILRKCRDELAKDRDKRTPEWAADDAFFSGVATRLMGVKEAWRNPTMHVEIGYDDESAKDVWSHVSSFMRHLATKLAE